MSMTLNMNSLTIDESTMRELVVGLTKKLTDEGMLIEAGWVGLAAMAVPPEAGPHQRDVMRNMFYAGAQHLFASIMSILEPGKEPTDKDCERLSKISDELKRFGDSLQADLRGPMQ